jgi:hypothetical protein
MKLLAVLLAFTSGMSSLLAPQASFESSTRIAITDTWQGVSTVRGVQVPATISTSCGGDPLKAAFFTGSADRTGGELAASVTSDQTHLAASFDYFARTLNATS